ncbi:MAG: YfhO family protein, partial [Bacteroidales bacterium]|nr:YfhO family protein [Bacteroidales bacterium]
VFGMTSYAVARASFLSMNAAIAWIPFQLWSSYNFICEISRDETRDEKKFIVFHTIFLTLQLLSGHAQITWYTQILVILWIGLWLFQKKSKNFFRRALPLGFSIICAALICAVQLIPTAEYLLQSQRADAVTFDYAVNYSFWGWRILTLFSPNLFGNPGSGNYWVSADNYWEDAIYFGLLPILLTIVVVIINLKATRSINSNTRKTIYFFSVTAFIGFIFALGKNTVIFPFFYQYIPTFDLFQAPTRFNLYLAVSGAVLTGYGFDLWKKPVGRWLYWSRLGAMAGMGAVLTSLMAKIILEERIQESYLSGAIETSILFLVAALLNLTFAENGPRKWLWHAAVILAVLADLIYAGWFSNPGIKITHENLQKQAEWYPFGNSRMWLPTADESILKFEKFFRFDSFKLPQQGDQLFYVFLPNTNLFFGKHAINNYDPFVPSRFSRFQSDIIETLDISKPSTLAFLNIGMVQRTDLTGEKLYHFPIEGAQRYHFINCADFSTNEEESLTKTKNLITNDEFLDMV